MNTRDDESFGVFVGIDWADTKHDVCLQAAGTTHRVFEQFSHRPAEIEAWVQSLRRRFSDPDSISRLIIVPCQAQENPADVFTHDRAHFVF